ncbi:MAG: sulfatase [Arachnia sp.]
MPGSLSPAHRPAPARCVLGKAGLAVVLPVALMLGTTGCVGEAGSADRPTPQASRKDDAWEAKLEYLADVAQSPQPEDSPNIVIVQYDDLGLGDLGFSGSSAIQTPTIDGFAANGVVLTNYHAPAAVCSPSRAGLLTGRLGPVAGVPDVLFPSPPATEPASSPASQPGLPRSEITMAEILQARGYDTSMVGKWHLGDTEGSLPNDAGFDSFVGSLYSNDMDPFRIYRDREVMIETVDQTTLDDLYTDEAVKVIESAASADDPFFLYFAHNFPHEPLAVAQRNIGRSDAGAYGDVVEGLDDGFARIMDALEAGSATDDTIVILTSDNGPWYQGSAGGLRGRKGSINEGGQRVPFVISWPEGIEGGRSLDTMVMGTDVLPTILDWLGLEAPTDRHIDGSSMAPLLAGERDSVSQFYYYFAGQQLLAVSDGRYKYYARQPYLYVTSGKDGGYPSDQGPWLFDLKSDPQESYDVLGLYPQIGAQLAAELERRAAQQTANPRGWS